MNKLHMARQYMNYLFFAQTRHGIHSSFVYKFLEEVLYDRTKYSDYRIIEKVTEELKRNHTSIETTDFGSPLIHKAYSFRKRRISEIASRAGISVRHGRLLYRIVKHFKPATMLEIGTSLGISTMYQAMGNPDAQFTGLEGCANISSIARKNLDHVNCRHVELKTAPFGSSLPGVLKSFSMPLNYAFIDGDHSYEGTLNYFGQLLNHTNPDSIIILHDIHWSSGMEKAWAEIKEHPEVKVTLDLFYMGIVFFRKELSKQNFRIRY